MKNITNAKTAQQGLITGLIFFAALFGAFVISSSKSAALSGSDFNAGRIIDDVVFYNNSTMTPAQIQQFLNSKVPACDTNGTQPYAGTTRAAYGTSRGYPPPYTCLKDYSQNVPTVTNSGSDLCKGSISGGVKTASQIIWDVSQSCGINPQVLIVMLQKEMSLITDDWPWSSQYDKAMGYACPDSGPNNSANCDSAYFGFFNQVYNAAKAYRRYEANPTWYNYRASRNNFILYNPNTDCGGTNVFIQNQATASLYIYTPYQPNQAALNNLYGLGDGCSAYGNRNFWRLFNDWFGSPINLSAQQYGWNFVSQSAFIDPAYTQQFTSRPTVAPGQRIYLQVRARNNGFRAWTSDIIRLGTSRTQDRSSQFYDATTWLAPQRPARLKEATVLPGQIGTFEFSVLAPSTARTYKEYFSLLAEGVQWMNDPGLFFLINVNTPNTPTTTKYLLSSGESIKWNERLVSPDRNTTLTLGTNGSVVARTNFRQTWNVGNGGDRENVFIMQTDGNLVLYDKNWRALWNSGTQGNPGARLAVQTDGNLVIYSATSTPLWNSTTISRPNNLNIINNQLDVGGVLLPGQSLSTPNRTMSLILQGDGNLVLYNGTTALWSSKTAGKKAAFLAKQGDGNLVLYDENLQPIWFSSTKKGILGNLYLLVQEDGNLVLYDWHGNPYWSTGTVVNR